mmetsp:Transcript_46009/g.110337  ORF Transcript_46009/g.110337 Transcript_46009/m.110337 type:complete len:218 (-) Transcript_46009:493-1146(-)
MAAPASLKGLLIIGSRKSCVSCAVAPGRPGSDLRRWWPVRELITCMHSTGWRILESWGSSSVRWIVSDVSIPAIFSSCSGESKMVARSKSERELRSAISAPRRSRAIATTLEAARCSARIERALVGEPGNEPCLLAGKEPCLLAPLEDLLAMLAGLEDLSERSESESSSSPRNGTRSLSVEPAVFSFCVSAPPPPRAAASRSLMVGRSLRGDDGGDF